jgi:hypothetical protein
MILKLLWLIDPLLGKDRETKNETTAVTRQRPTRLWTGWKAVFPAGSVPMAANAIMDVTMVRDVFYAVRVKGLNFAVVKLTTVQATKLPLWHKIRKMDMICPLKPVLTEDLCVMQMEEFSIPCYMCEMYT